MYLFYGYHENQCNTDGFSQYNTIQYNTTQCVYYPMFIRNFTRWSSFFLKTSKKLGFNNLLFWCTDIKFVVTWNTVNWNSVSHFVWFMFCYGAIHFWSCSDATHSINQRDQTLTHSPDRTMLVIKKYETPFRQGKWKAKFSKNLTVK